jgi:hypothetical protein
MPFLQEGETERHTFDSLLFHVTEEMDIPSHAIFRNRNWIRANKKNDIEQDEENMHGKGNSKSE